MIKPISTSHPLNHPLTHYCTSLHLCATYLPLTFSNLAYSKMSQEEYDTFKLGDWELQSGEKLVDAHLAYKTFGDPASPAIVYPSWFSGRMYFL